MALLKEEKLETPVRGGLEGVFPHVQKKMVDQRAMHVSGSQRVP